MVNIIDDYEQILITVQQGVIFENFSNYEHGGEPPTPYIYIRDPPNIAEFIDMPRIAASYLRKLGQGSYADFVLKFKLIVNRLDNAGVGGGTGSGFMTSYFTHDDRVTNYTLGQSHADGFGVFIRTWETANIIRIVNMQHAWNQPGNNASDIYFLEGFLGHPFYINFWRQSSMLHLETYDDPEMTVPSSLISNPNYSWELLKTDLTPDTTAYTYFLPLTGRGGSDLPFYTSGTVSELIL